MEWLDFSLWMILVKSHAKIPQKVCRSAGFGPSGPNNVRFGSNLDMLSLKSNKHQNLWNSLVIMVMAWLGSTFHEIRWSVGGENYRYRPPTVALVRRSAAMELRRRGHGASSAAGRGRELHECSQRAPFAGAGGRTAAATRQSVLHRARITARSAGDHSNRSRRG